MSDAETEVQDGTDLYEFLDRPIANYVDGEWTQPSGGVAETVVNPATGETLGDTPVSTESDVDAVVGTAEKAFGQWRQTPVEERVQPLFRFKSLLEEHQSEIAELLVREHGKTRAEAEGELRRGIENVEVACGAPTLLQGGHLQHAAPGIDETAVRHPLGVFTAITPFNFPGMIPLWFLPYAVACGNAFILKPSERTPYTAVALFELLERAGFPNGVVSLVHGGPDTVNALLTHDDVVGASFVGSTGVAEHVYETAAANGKRVQAQGGAKNHVIVSDAADLSYAAEKTVSSAFANTGQRCLANPVAVVHDDVYDEFAELVVERTAAQTVGNGLDNGVDIGPVVSGEAKARIESAIETGIAEGAELLLDGREQASSDDGSFLAPSVFGDVTPEMTVATEELFGPVLALIRAADLDEAIDIANRSRYGNAASVFTNRGDEAATCRHELDAGNVGINVGTAAPMAFFHFGGQKDSFFGDLHAQAEDVVRFYTDETVYIERRPDQKV